MPNENMNPFTYEFLLGVTVLLLLAMYWVGSVKQKHNERLARQEAKQARRHPSQRGW
jgi:hypothetical protein